MEKRERERGEYNISSYTSRINSRIRFTMGTRLIAISSSRNYTTANELERQNESAPAYCNFNSASNSKALNFSRTTNRKKRRRIPVGTFPDEITCLPRTLEQNGVRFYFFYFLFR